MEDFEILAILVLVAAIAFVIVISALSSKRNQQPVAPTQGTERRKSYQDAKVHRVIDGDTVIVSSYWSTTTIRLDAIDCPEDGQHWGDIAKYGLIKLIGGRRIRVDEHSVDDYGRTVATIYVQHGNDWMNVNARMVTLGHAWVMRRYYEHLPKERRDELNRLERWAKAKKVGLWRHECPVPPWKWRGGKGE